MAELTHFYNSEDTLVDVEGTGAFVTDLSISGASLTANTKYLVIARALLGSSSATQHVQFRVDTDDTATLAAKSTALYEFQLTGTGEFLSYFFVHSFTTDSSPAAVNLQHKGASSNQVRVDQMSLFLLDLDAIGTEGTDYYEDIQPSDSGSDLSESEATFVFAQIAGSNLGTDEHLILGYATILTDNLGKWAATSLYAAYDVSTAVEVGRHQAEGEDTAEKRLSGYAIRHQASSGTPNVTLYGVDEAGGGANNSDGGAYLIALPTSLFADFVDDYEAGAIAIDGVETTIATSGSYTPTVTGNHLIFGRSNGNDTPTFLGRMWVESTTTEIRTGDEPLTHNQIWDGAKDDEQQVTFQRYSITTAETFNLRSQSTFANFDQEHRWLIIVNLNPPAVAAAPVFRRRQLTTVRM